ncbi:hypothetical protein ABLE91_01935 [Aquabacter sp. CN5-332]|uniref:hypothetical protein n=1 Tax=Aquabacter sp. CN5-332 TaxID=3156608 RepID=UPI0032B5E5E2
MSTRTRKIRRILELQDLLHRASEWKLAGIRAEIAENHRTRDTLINTLSDEVLGPLLVDVTARRLRTVALVHGQLTRAEDVQVAQVREEARRLKQVERMAETVRRADDQAREKADLHTLLDGIAAKPAPTVDASLPPA